MEVVALALVMVMATAVGGSFAQETAQLQLLHAKLVRKHDPSCSSS
jgi:hypothetical protein